jgi:peptidoglycan DL-endopeptidase CwlO
VALRQSRRLLRGVMAAGVVITVMSTTVLAASADPAGGGNTDPTVQYQQLSQQAAALQEQLNNAQVDLTNKQNQLNQANNDENTAKQALAAAQAQEDQFRGSVDALTLASFEGARVSQLSALMTGSSARDYLDRSTDLQNLADDSDRVLLTFQAAVGQASAAAARAANDQKSAQDATAAAQALVAQISQQKTTLQTQIQQVQQALDQLSAAQRHALTSDTGPVGIYIGSPGIANSALQAALSRRGDAYVYGDDGPSTFDCSGLVKWAYGTVGVDLPHSAAAQSQLGIAVSRADLQVGDLVFFGSPATHVGFYVGNGMMLDAPTSGEVVRVEPLFSNYSGARRLTA